MKVLMVCLGNICRSPMAEGILRDKAIAKGLDIEIDSCGTAAYHVGESPDPRSTAKSAEHGIDISMLRGRQFQQKDFDRFDHILCMDKSNYRNVNRLARNAEDENKVDLMLSYSYPNEEKDVPDPYYGGIDGFEHVFQLLDHACDNFINVVSSEK